MTNKVLYSYITCIHIIIILDFISLPVTQMPKDNSLCMIPECPNRKYVEMNGFIHDYCGKTHANVAKMRGILCEFLSFYYFLGLKN